MPVPQAGFHKGPYGFAGGIFFVCQSMPDKFSIYLAVKEDYYLRTRCDQSAIKPFHFEKRQGEMLCEEVRGVGLL